MFDLVLHVIYTLHIQAGVREHKNIALPLKEYYLTWAACQKGGIKDVRRVYKALSIEAPLSVEFFQKYNAMENDQVCWDSIIYFCDIYSCL